MKYNVNKGIIKLNAQSRVLCYIATLLDNSVAPDVKLTIHVRKFPEMIIPLQFHNISYDIHDHWSSK